MICTCSPFHCGKGGTLLKRRVESDRHIYGVSCYRGREAQYLFRVYRAYLSMLPIKLDSRSTQWLIKGSLCLSRKNEHPILWITLVYPTWCLYGIWVLSYPGLHFFLLVLDPISLRHYVGEGLLIAHTPARIILVIESTGQCPLMIEIVRSFQIGDCDLSKSLASLRPCLFTCISCEELLEFQGVVLGNLIIVEAILVVTVHAEPIGCKFRMIIPSEASLEARISVCWGHYKHGSPNLQIEWPAWIQRKTIRLTKLHQGTEFRAIIRYDDLSKFGKLYHRMIPRNTDICDSDLSILCSTL